VPSTALETFEDDDADLLARASGPFDARARQAQAQFYSRHVRYLYGALKRHEGLMARVGGGAVEDIVQETFQRAFQYGKSFRPTPGLDVDRARLQTRAWLGRIAERLMSNAMSKPREIVASELIEQTSDEDASGPPSSPEVRAVRSVLEELTDREQDVLRVTALYQRHGEAHQRLPNDVSSELAERWGTNNENIRAIRSRAMKKLEARLRVVLGEQEGAAR
jgi:RNA polymerase sigma factor (sigma-70 family)